MEKKKILSTNRKFLKNNKIIKKFEAGISLVGNEVKAILSGSFIIDNSYIKITKNNNLVMSNSKLKTSSSILNFDPSREKQLLLHKSEIKTIIQKSKEQKLQIIPTKIYLLKNKVKVEVCLAKHIGNHVNKKIKKDSQVKREVLNYKRKL